MSSRPSWWLTSFSFGKPGLARMRQRLLDVTGGGVAGPDHAELAVVDGATIHGQQVASPPAGRRTGRPCPACAPAPGPRAWAAADGAATMTQSAPRPPVSLQHHGAQVLLAGVHQAAAVEGARLLQALARALGQDQLAGAELPGHEQVHEPHGAGPDHHDRVPLGDAAQLGAVHRAAHRLGQGGVLAGQPGPARRVGHLDHVPVSHRQLRDDQVLGHAPGKGEAHGLEVRAQVGPPPRQ